METIQTLPVKESFLKKIIKLFEPREKYLLSPALDFLMAGGASIILFGFVYLLIAKNTSTFAFGWAVYYLAFIVNYPHFAASYQIIYGDNGKDFLNFKGNRNYALKLWWAGVIVPVILLSYFFYAYSMTSSVMVGYLINAMYFFVGWHYVKQIFGCVVVLSGVRGIYYGKFERWSILVPLYTLWALSFVNANLYGNISQYYQIPFTSFNIPHIYLNIIYVILAVSSIILIVNIWRKYRRENVLPPISAIAAVASIYIWYIPMIYHPYFYFIIPFFHSLQYMLFVLAYKRNQSVMGFQSINEKEKSNSITIFSSLFFIFLPIIMILIAMMNKYSFSLERLLTENYGKISGITPLAWFCLASTILICIAIFLALKYTAKITPWGKFLSFIFATTIFGATLFVLAPVTLEIFSRNKILPEFFLYNKDVFGTSLYIFLFTIFVNIHHYFVDNIIWKRDNPHLKEYLFKK